MYQLYDENRKKRYALTGLIKEIGRTSECDLCLANDDQVSRVHARLDWDGTGWVLVDMGSTNGTLVNGENISEKKLAPGDMIEIGDTQLRFLPLDVGDEVARKKTTKITKAEQTGQRMQADPTRPFAMGKTIPKKSN